MDWSQFEKNITLPAYLEYMMRINKTHFILPFLRERTRAFDPSYCYFKGYHISDEYELIERRGDGGCDLIKHLCSMLTNGGMKRGTEYKNRIIDWTGDCNKMIGIEC